MNAVSPTVYGTLACLVASVFLFDTPQRDIATGVVPSHYEHNWKVVVDDDGGGLNYEFENFIKTNTLPIQISGECDSACTFFLRVPTTCVYPWALLGFHEAHLAGHPDVRIDLATVDSYRKYPKIIRQWIDENGGLTSKLIYLKGDEAIRRGVRSCED